jgi:hypothetical protein
MEGRLVWRCQYFDSWVCDPQRQAAGDDKATAAGNVK